MLEVLQYPHTVLKQAARPVDLEKPLDQIKHLAERMVETLKRADGYGLAAPQVGHSVRVIVIYIQEVGNNHYLTMVNPEIISSSDEDEVGEEGCLSFPGAFGRVKRSLGVGVRWYDLATGREKQQNFFELEARIIQHEIDHLNGVLMVDKLGPLKSVFLKKFFRKK